GETRLVEHRGPCRLRLPARPARLRAHLPARAAAPPRLRHRLDVIGAAHGPPPPPAQPAQDGAGQRTDPPLAQPGRQEAAHGPPPTPLQGTPGGRRAYGRPPGVSGRGSGEATARGATSP